MTGPLEVTVDGRPGRLPLPASPAPPGWLGIAGALGPRGVVLLPGGYGGDLALDAAQQLMVGVAERTDALALKLGGNGGQVEPGRRRGEHPFRSIGVGIVRATAP
jgi:hypothetical protein